MESITLQVGNSIISSGDAIGQIQFAAPAESDGGASRYIVGRVYSEAEGAFNASSNPASIVFATSSADNLPASGKIKISHEGHILPLLNNSYDIGGESFQFANFYMYDNLYVSGVSVIDGVNQIVGAEDYMLASGMIVDGGTP